MAFEKYVLALLIGVLAIGYIEGASKSDCTAAEFKSIDTCLTPFPTAAQSLINKTCNLTDDMCKAGVKVAECLNKDKFITDKCRGYLPTYIDAQLALVNLKCTLSGIENKCKTHINTGAAPSLVISLSCLLVSVIAGLHYAT